MSKILNAIEVDRILKSGEFDGFIGVLEGEQLEFKSAPYLLDQDAPKMELAKDVSALANASGGIIVIGVQTERNPTVQGDEARRIGRFEEELIDRDRYQKVIADWVYPPIPGLKVAWHPSSAQPKKGLVSILVPSEATAEQPYIVVRIVEATGKISGSVVGYFARTGPAVSPISAPYMRDRLKDGLRFSDLSGQLQDIQVALANLASPRQKPMPTASIDIENRVLKGRNSVGLGESPTFFLASHALENVQFPTLFRSRDTDLVRLLESPPTLRQSGFDLGKDASTIVAGQIRRTMTPKRKVLEFWKDGFLLFEAAADDWFLCWGMRSTEETGLRINNIVLTEVTYLFCELVLRAYQQATPVPKGLAIELGLLDMTVNGKPCTLSTYYPSEFNVGDGGQKAPEDSGTFRQEFELKGADAGMVAYELLRIVYAWFGFEEDSIPYAERDKGPGRVDPATIIGR